MFFVDKKKLNALFDVMFASRKKCPWAATVSVETSLRDMIAETEELLVEIKQGKNKEAMEEFGDVLATALFFGIIAEEKGLFRMDDSVSLFLEKFEKRKPWVFGKMKVETEEEARALYNALKKKEKEERSTRCAKP